jgi:hypothetical protein
MKIKTKIHAGGRCDPGTTTPPPPPNRPGSPLPL